MFKWLFKKKKVENKKVEENKKEINFVEMLNMDIIQQKHLHQAMGRAILPSMILKMQEKTMTLFHLKALPKMQGLVTQPQE